MAHFLDPILNLWPRRAQAGSAPNLDMPSLETKEQVPQRLVALADLGRAAWSARDYTSLARQGYERNPTAHACVRLIAQNAASVPFEIRVNDRASPDHPARQLLERPNEEQSGVELREALLGHLSLAGNAYLELVRIGDQPRALYALRPDRMRVIAGPDGWPQAYEYRMGASVQTFRRDPRDDQFSLLHLKNFAPLQDLYGLSPLEAAAQALDIQNAGAAWAKALIDNSARPSGALVFQGPGRLSEDQFSRLKAEISDSHAGPGNAGRPLLLEGGLDWKPMSLSPAEMDFLQARYAAGREIALAFGVPPLLLGLPGDNSYANYREANLAFWRLTIVPLATKLCAALERFLTPHYGPQFRLSCCFDQVPALAAEREALWAQIAAADFLKPEEKRQMAGLASRSAQGA